MGRHLIWCTAPTSAVLRRCPFHARLEAKRFLFWVSRRLNNQALEQVSLSKGFNSTREPP